MNPRYPVYIPSKGRAGWRYSVKHLAKMGVPYLVIVEEQEVSQYAATLGSDRLLVLDAAYQRDYDACTELTPDQSRGSGPARNFAWDHAKAGGHARHWVVDDNIRGWFRLYDNLKTPVKTGAIFRAMEDFCDRYTNVAMAGPNYFRFAPRREQIPPITLNTRIYSCNLVLTDAPFRWRGRYNEDTILSLDLLKAGWCTVLFNAFLQFKEDTRLLKGGNTDELYRNGTLEKSQMLVREHPDVAKLTRKWNRWHHHVDYRPFKANRLKRKPGLVIPEGTNEYGMKLVRLSAPTAHAEAD